MASAKSFMLSCMSLALMCWDHTLACLSRDFRTVHWYCAHAASSEPVTIGEGLWAPMDFELQGGREVLAEPYICLFLVILRDTLSSHHERSRDTLVAPLPTITAGAAARVAAQDPENACMRSYG